MNRIYDLEQRTYLFAKNCRFFVKALPKSLSNIEDGRAADKIFGVCRHKLH